MGHGISRSWWGQGTAVNELALGGFEFEAPVVPQEEMEHSWLDTGNTKVQVSL